MTNIRNMAADAKRASFSMAQASSEQKNQALQAVIDSLKKHEEAILQANRTDLALARAQGLSDPLLERLSLENRLDGIVEDIKEVMRLPDPVGRTFEEKSLPNGLYAARRSVPIGVIGVIYESRPNVTIDVAVLAIKTGNAVLLKGGAETLHTNQVLVKLIQEALTTVGLCKESVQLITSSDRSEIKELLSCHEYVDLIIPRGGAGLQQFCRQNSSIPVITGGVGICHLFVDESADLQKSLSVIANAKIQRPTVCNALDTLLVHEAIASKFLPRLIEELGKKGVSFRLDPQANGLVKSPLCKLAEEKDWDTEWLSLVLGVKIVSSLEEALEHIRAHSTSHSDGILTENQAHAELFLNRVDSAVVYVNASTRFTDGGQLGLGSEVAVSTQKLHSRGPMGLQGLTTYKWIVKGNYHFRT